MTLRTRAIPLLAAAGLLVAACGEGVPEAGDLVEDEAVEDEAADPEAGDPDAHFDLAIAESPLGEHLVDGEGLTLYRFENDEPGVSNCTDECLENWPPLLVEEEPAAGHGIDEELVGTIEREDDGSTQVTYDGMPLYYWAADAAPGDVDGQGVNDAWWVVAPDGTPVTGAADAPVDDGDGASDY